MTKQCIGWGLAWIALTAASGCAGSLKLTEDQEKNRLALTDTEAASRLKEYLTPENHIGGICRYVDPLIRGQGSDAQLELEDRIVSFVAFKQVAIGGNVTGNVMAGTGVVHTSYKLVPIRYSEDLSKIKRIQAVDHLSQCPCSPKDWSAVIVHPADGPAFYIMVDPASMGDLVTVLSYFAPNAELRKGAGF